MWRIIGYGLLGLLALLVLLLLFPIFVRVQYREELTVRVRVLGIPCYRFSSEKGRRKSEATAKRKKKAKTKDKPAGHNDKHGFLTDLANDLKKDGVSAVLGKLKALAQLAVGSAKRVLRSVTVDRLQLQLFIASEDAATTAIRTGQVCAALYPSLSALQGAVSIRHRAVTVTPDYLAEKGRVAADVKLRVVPIRLLWAALWTVLKLGSIADRDITEKKKEEQEHGK